MKREKKPTNKDELNPDNEKFFDDFWPNTFHKDQFGFLDEFEVQFRLMEQQMNHFYKKALQGNRPSENNKNIQVYGWTYRVGPDGQPHFQEFGNVPERLQHPKQNQIQDSIEPHIDIQETDKEIYITLEIPGVDKEDINLNIIDKFLRIQVTNDTYPFHKEIKLSSEINEKKTQATYNNGILSITLEKIRSKKGRKINIK